MAAYRDLASAHAASNSSEQNEAYVSSGGSQSLPARRDNVVQRDQNSLPARNERVDGYDELFDPAVTSDFECPICMMVLRDPVQTACGHRFCKQCIEHHMRLNGRKCPSDNQQLKEFDVFSDNFAKREINQFTVKCRTIKNGKEGCEWKGELGKLDDHMNTCLFLDVACPKGCGQTIERKVLDNHIKKECPKRMMECPHCKSDVQQKNYKDHMERCQKVSVNCPQCAKKMVREKLATHDKECPKAQEACEFKSYGCKWVGLRTNLASHLQNDMVVHLSFVVAAISVLFPNSREKSKGSSSKSDTSTVTFDELSHKVSKNEEVLNQMKETTEQMERKLRETVARFERQQAERDTAATTIRNSITELEARTCNGIYLWRITGYARHLENAREGLATAVHSPPFYTAFYGYKLCLRVNPNGVDTGYGSHISLFVHMMQSDWDDTLEWPFSGRISLSILDQSDDGEYKRHISETLVTRPNLLAFQRPTTPRNHKGYGYVEFAHLEALQDRQYVKNDYLLVRVQVYN